MAEIFELVWTPTLETLYMVLFSTIFSILLGFPFGILMAITEKDGIFEKPLLNKVLNSIVNLLRSFPFLILMILLFPLSKLIIGKSIGTTATIVPLAIGAAPFVARVIESSLKEVDKGVIELSLSMGATVPQIIFRVLLPEALPSIILGIALTVINLIGYSAMAGTLGGGGLGDLAIRYGHYRFQTDVMLLAVVVIVILVQSVQFIGNTLAKKLNKK